MANMEKHDTPEVLTVLNHAISVSYKSNYISANKLVLYQKKKNDSEHFMGFTLDG